MTYATQAEIQSGHDRQLWAEALHARHNLTGQVCQIHKASWIAKDGSCAQYSGPVHTVVVGA